MKYPTDSYVTASSAILTALSVSVGLEKHNLDSKQIDRALRTSEIGRILAAEHGRWISVSYDRLKRFGYHFDTF